MFKNVFFAALFAPALALAQGADTCMTAGELDAGLIDWYGESPVETSDDGSMVLWQNTETGTWTLVAYRPSGMACTLDSGSTGLAGAAADQIMASYDGSVLR